MWIAPADLVATVRHKLQVHCALYVLIVQSFTSSESLDYASRSWCSWPSISKMHPVEAYSWNFKLRSFFKKLVYVSTWQVQELVYVYDKHPVIHMLEASCPLVVSVKLLHFSIYSRCLDIARCWKV